MHLQKPAKTPLKFKTQTNIYISLRDGNQYSAGVCLWNQITSTIFSSAVLIRSKRSPALSMNGVRCAINPEWIVRFTACIEYGMVCKLSLLHEAEAEVQRNNKRIRTISKHIKLTARWSRSDGCLQSDPIPIGRKVRNLILFLALSLIQHRHCETGVKYTHT